ncbi:Zinc carboxypeptidase family protein [Brugia pahangi]
MIGRYLMRISISVLFLLLSDTSTLIRGSLSDSQKYKVIRIVPEYKNQLAIINELFYQSTESQLNFWRAPTGIGQAVDIMLQSSMIHSLANFFKQNNITFKIIINDVEKLIYEREGQPRKSNGQNYATVTAFNSILESFMKRSKDANLIRNKAKYKFGDYHSYDTIISWLNEIEHFYPNIAKVFTIGQTFEGRNIKGIKIGNPIDKINKRIIWIDAGIHAREWASIHTALYFIDQLISQYGIDSQITSYIDTLNFYIVPVVNPDGYEYSRSDLTPHARFWRKNRGKKVCFKDRWYRKRCCNGVDLNRNFDFYWGETGSSSHICSEIYHGNAPFSEPETRAIRDKLLSAEMFGKIDAFITLHTYSQMWIYPYGHQRRSFPNDVKDLEKVGKQAVKAVENVYGTKFRLGTGADILYPSSGGSDDWAKSKAGVKFVYLLELRPGENDFDGFLLDRRQLIPTGRETWAGVRVVIDAVMRSKKVRPVDIPLKLNYNETKAIKRISTFHFPLQYSRKFVTTAPPLIKSQSLRPINYNYHLENLQQRHSIIRRKFSQQFQNRICTDISPWCMNWIRINPNVCLTALTYMQQQCIRSCRFC